LGLGMNIDHASCNWFGPAIIFGIKFIVVSQFAIIVSSVNARRNTTQSKNVTTSLPARLRYFSRPLQNLLQLLGNNWRVEVVGISIWYKAKTLSYGLIFFFFPHFTFLCLRLFRLC
jgi:hypothetical protein